MRLEYSITDEILKAGYIATIENPLLNKYMGFISFDEFKEKLTQFKVWGVIDEKPAGIILFDGNCVHISILKEHFGKCGFLIKRALKKALEENDGLVGIIDKEDTKVHHFAERLGFKRIGMTNSILFYYRGF